LDKLTGTKKKVNTYDFVFNH
jgi:hypothetical protein